MIGNCNIRNCQIDDNDLRRHSVCLPLTLGAREFESTICVGAVSRMVSNLFLLA